MRRKQKNWLFLGYLDPKEGGYGTGITGIIETKNWEDEEQLGKVYIGSLQYIYNENLMVKS